MTCVSQEVKVGFKNLAMLPLCVIKSEAVPGIKIRPYYAPQKFYFPYSHEANDVTMLIVNLFFFK